MRPSLPATLLGPRVTPLPPQGLILPLRSAVGFALETPEVEMSRLCAKRQPPRASLQVHETYMLGSTAAGLGCGDAAAETTVMGSSKVA